MAQILAYKLDILGAAVNLRHNGPADVVGRFSGLYTCAAAKLSDPVVNRPDMDPFSLIPEEQVVLVRKAILFVDRNDLMDDGETHISQGEGTVPPRALLLGVVHYDRAVFLPLFHPLDVDGLFLKVNVRRRSFILPVPREAEYRLWRV